VGTVEIEPNLQWSVLPKSSDLSRNYRTRTICDLISLFGFLLALELIEFCGIEARYLAEFLKIPVCVCLLVVGFALNKLGDVLVTLQFGIFGKINENWKFARCPVPGLFLSLLVTADSRTELLKFDDILFLLFGEGRICSCNSLTKCDKGCRTAAGPFLLGSLIAIASLNATKAASRVALADSSRFSLATFYRSQDLRDFVLNRGLIEFKSGKIPKGHPSTCRVIATDLNMRNGARTRKISTNFSFCSLAVNLHEDETTSVSSEHSVNLDVSENLSLD